MANVKGRKQRIKLIGKYTNDVCHANATEPACITEIPTKLTESV